MTGWVPLHWREREGAKLSYIKCGCTHTNNGTFSASRNVSVGQVGGSFTSALMTFHHNLPDLSMTARRAPKYRMAKTIFATGERFIPCKLSANSKNTPNAGITDSI